MVTRMWVLAAAGMVAALTACGQLAGGKDGEAPVAVEPALSADADPSPTPIPEVAAVAIEPCDVLSCHALGDMSLFELSQVGRKEGAAIVSDGRDGFLLYGPYMAFEPGTYRLILNGTVNAPGGAKIDVIGAVGALTFADIPLPQQSGNLVDTIVTIPQAVSDLEVRVFVTSDSLVRIDSVTLRPAS